MKNRTNTKSIPRIVMLFMIVTLATIPVIPLAGGQAPETTFTIGWGAAPTDTLNPTAISQNDGGAYNVLHLLYDTLVRTDMNGNTVPDLAQSWIYTNSTTLVFKLMTNTTWHDGKPFTADDVVFTLNLYFKHPEFYAATNVVNVKSVTAIDKSTVQLQLKKPDAPLLSARLVGAYILPKHIWESVANFTAFTNPNPIGTGPFMFVKWGGPNTYVEFKANPNYFLGKPRVDRVVIRHFTDYNSLVLALKSGEVDHAGPLIPATMAPTLANVTGVQVITRPDLRYVYFDFNQYEAGFGNPTLRDRRVRIALSYAVDKAALAAVSWSGYATPMKTIIPSSLANWINPKTPGYDFDLKKAAQMLDDAGYKVGNDGIRVSPNGIRMSYRIEVPSNYPAEFRSAQMISNWWKQIGVESTPQLVDVGSLADEQAAWKHDTYIWVWGAGGLDPDFNLKVLIGSQAKPAPNPGLNDCGMMNATYDALYDQQMQETDLVKRRDMVWRMQDIAHQEAAYIPLYTPMAIQAFRNDRFTSIPPGKIPPLAQSSVTKDFVINMRPIVARPTTTATTVTAPYGMGLETLGIIAILVVAVIAVAFFAAKRKKTGAQEKS